MNRVFMIMLLVLLGIAPRAVAQLPVTGRPVANLAFFDSAIQNYMAQRNLTSAVVAVMKNGVVVYQRGFGYNYDGAPLPEITPMRIGSISKRLVSECIAHLNESGAFFPAGLDTRVFNVGQPGGGILNIAPWPSLGDQRIGNITIAHLLSHSSGLGDYANSERAIGQAMGVGCPPGIDNMIRYALGRPLVHAPGNAPEGAYVNFGYAVLARVVRQVSGMPVEEYIRRHIITADMWAPSTEVFAGRPFRSEQNWREPRYISDDIWLNVFDPGCSPIAFVSAPYGGFDLVATVGAGGLVCSPVALLRFLEAHQGGSAGFVGGIAGTSACCSIRSSDRVAIAVLVSQTNVGQPSFAAEINDMLLALIDAGGFAWPSRSAEGFWLQFGATTFGTGGYNDPFGTMQSALLRTTAGTKLRIKPGTTNWTGTISEKMLIDAPLGTVRIGG